MEKWMEDNTCLCSWVMTPKIQPAPNHPLARESIYLSARRVYRNGPINVPNQPDLYVDLQGGNLFC